MAQQFETVQFLPAGVRGQLGGELVCYGRFVVHQEWPRMEAGTQGDAINPWGVALFRSLKTAAPKAASEQSAYDKWLDQTSDREQARSDRIHGAEGVIPGPLWLVLFLIAALIFAFMLFFADSGERAVVQGVLIGSVIAAIAATLLLIRFLDDPFRSGFGPATGGDGANVTNPGPGTARRAAARATALRRDRNEARSLSQGPR